MKKIVIIYLIIFLDSVILSGQQNALENNKQSFIHQISFDFGAHHNYYFGDNKYIKYDSSIYCPGACTQPFVGLKRIPTYDIHFGFIYNILYKNKFCINFEILYYNRRTKFEGDSATIIKYVHTIPYKNIIKYDTSPRSIETSIYLEYILLNKIGFTCGFQYTLLTMNRNKLIDFEGNQIIEKRKLFLDYRKFEFPNYIGKFYLSCKINYYLNINNFKFNFYLGIDRQYSKFYYFQVGLNVPFYKIKNNKSYILTGFIK